jgi:hypothetical protein
MRGIRGVLVLLVALGLAPSAGAAELQLSKHDYSPKRSRKLVVTAALERPIRAGLQLVTAHGGLVGWVVRPQYRRYLTFRWNGRIDGARVPDGRYRLRLVEPRGKRVRVLAVRPFLIDSVAPGLVRFDTHTLSSRPFAGDGRLLTTISPNGDGLRDSAKVSFTLTEPAWVRFVVTRTGFLGFEPIHELTADLPAGRHSFTWFPEKTIASRTYLVRLHAVDPAGNRRIYGAANAESGRRPSGPVIRVLGLDAGFAGESYVPGQIASLMVETDAEALQAQVFRAGPEEVPTYDDTVMNGVPVGEPFDLLWAQKRDGPSAVRLQIGQWPAGLYFVKLTADGRVGYAPFIVRHSQFGTSRVAVVLPTNTWQAYNFRDENGNGWGDTWYAKGSQSTIRLGRAYLRRGVPPQYRKYDLGFLRWLALRGKTVDFISETDLETIDSGDTLARLYDLVVFSGHTEYVTRHEYDLVQRYRDLGGNLIFLSANNFFWEVRRQGRVLQRTRKWRELGRPEAAVIGTQYRANDDGRIQRPFVVRATGAAPWFFSETGLADGSSFGPLGGYGIEIDATAPGVTPPGTIVLAEIPDVYAPGVTAQMTYYETPAGAKVFAAGALDFGGTALEWPVSQLLDNLWARLAVP